MRADLETLNGLNWLNDQVNERLHGNDKFLTAAVLTPVHGSIGSIDHQLLLQFDRLTCTLQLQSTRLELFFYTKLLKEGYSGVRRWTNMVHNNYRTITIIHY